MTLEDIMTLFGILVDEEFELEADGNLPPKVKALFNACSGDLTPVAKYIKSTTFTYTAGSTTTLALPSDFFEFIPKSPLWFNDGTANSPADEVDFDDTANSGWYRVGSVVYLREPPDDNGTYTLYYFASLPTFVGTPSVSPVIPSPFHELYALYAAMRWVQGYADVDELPSKKDFKGDYDEMKARFEDHQLKDFRLPFTTTKDVLPKVTTIDEDDDSVE